MSQVDGSRMVLLPEVAARTGMSKSFFYCYRNQGKLSLPLEKVGGRLQVREEALVEWMRMRRVLESSRTTHLGKEVLALIGATKDYPGVSPLVFPDIFQAFVAKLDDAFCLAIESMKVDRQIGLEEFVDRFEFIVEQVDAELTEGLPEGAQLVFSPPFYDCVMRWRQRLFDHVEQEYRKVFQSQVRTFLYGIKHQSWKTKEEKLESLRFYVPEALWAMSGFSLGERESMVEEMLVEDGQGEKP